ncbi:MAG: hypothetical protein K6E95_03230 [Lachnospiraceae bacterium]|nr:hypothetical protein [Lachnospiraceae bacterium]
MKKTYKDIINTSIGTVYSAGIANRILQYMDKIRNVSDEGQARRWGMELLQNCADTAYEGKNVDAEITLDEDKLTFKHNGKPFRVKDILSIINQVSSKNPNENTVGRFGSGFMSTFMLSEQVTIRSILSDKGEDENGNEIELPFRSFEVTLDRKGRTKEEVIESIKNSMVQLLRVDENGLMKKIDPSALNTSFIYKLENEDSKKCAKVGMEDLKNTVRYILLFAKAIGSVRLIDNVSNEDVTFRRGDSEKVDEDLKVFEVLENGTSGECIHRLAYLTDGELTLAAPCEKVVSVAEGQQRCCYRFLPIPELSPRVYTVFPLIGSEHFPFSVIVNSLSFRPNEPRNGISLVDNAQSEDSKVNKELMKRAVKMYSCILDSAVLQGFDGFENAVSIPEQHEDKEMSSQWVQDELYGELYRNICRKKMINVSIKDAAGGLKRCRMSLSDIGMHIVDAASDKEKQAVKELVSRFRDFYYPNGEEAWNDALRNYPVSEDKIITAEKLYLNAREYVSRNFTGDTSEFVNWCSELYALSKENDLLHNLIITSKAPVFPNQSDTENADRLRKYGEIYTDNGIPEVLKDVSEKLDRLTARNFDEKLEIRKMLVHKDFATDGNAMPAAYETARIVKYISDRSDRKFPVQNFICYERTYTNAWYEAWKLMMSCMKDRTMYDACSLFFHKEDMPPYETLEEHWYSNDSMWFNSIKGICNLVCERIENAGDVQGLTELLESSGEDETYGKLVGFMSAAFQNGFKIKEVNSRLFPDLTGTLRNVFNSWDKNFYYDAVEHTELYSIAQPFAGIYGECELRGRTIDRKIPFEYTGLPKQTDTKVCENINNALIRVFSQGPLSEATQEQQEACTKLLSLLRNDPEFTKEYFPNYISEEDQMKLLTPQSAVIMQRKADQVDALLSKHNIIDINDLDSLIDNLVKISMKESEAVYYDDDSDVLLDETSTLTGDERTELCRKIGKAGEDFVYNYLINSAEDEGYTVVSHDARETILQKTQQDNINTGISGITVLRGDHAGYKQSGWDFMVTTICNDEKKVKYYEVKTHSFNSVVSNIVALSNSQMRMAMQENDNYIVVKVKCNRYSFDCSLDGFYSDIGEQIADGRFTNTDRYSFNVLDRAQKN